MEWLITGLLIAAGAILLPWWIATHSDPGRKGGGLANDFMSGLAEQLDPRAALIASENEKRLEIEGEQDSGAPKDVPAEGSIERKS
jgi:hypothetical protein